MFDLIQLDVHGWCNTGSVLPSLVWGSYYTTGQWLKVFFLNKVTTSVILVQKIIFILVFIWFSINRYSSSFSSARDNHFTSSLVFIPEIILVLV